MAHPSSRRRFLKTGVFGALALATAGGLYRVLHQPAPLTPTQLDSAGRQALRAIAAALLAGEAKPGSPELERAVAGTEKAIAGLPLATQKEIADLFGLLVLGPTRRWLAGVPDDWAAARPEDVRAFLQSWRFHRLEMLQGAYAALHDLVLGPWYADPATWASIGYPGPLKELST